MATALMQIDPMQAMAPAQPRFKAVPYTGFKSRKIIVVWFHPHRVYYGKARFGEYECRSNNGRVPDPNIAKPVCSSCLDCTKSKGFKGVGSECKENSNLIFWDVKDKELCFTNLKPNGKTVLMAFWKKLVATRGKKFFWDFTTVINSVQARKDGKVFPTITLADAKADARPTKAMLKLFEETVTFEKGLLGY